MKIIAKINFSLNGVKYVKGEEIKGLTNDKINILNEKGYIEPLTYEDLVFLEKPKKETNKED